MFWRGLAGYLPANIIQGVVGVLSIVVFTRMLSPAAYGDYAIGFSAMAVAHTIVFTWTEAAMARFHAAQTDEQSRADHFRTLYLAWGAMALAFPLIAWAGLSLLPFEASAKLAAAAGLAMSPLRSLIKLAQERRRAAGDVRGAAQLDIAQTIGGFALGAALILLGFAGSAPLLGVGLVCGICLIFALPAELKAGRGGRFEAARARGYFAYGLPVALSLILSLVLTTTDRFVLAGLGDSAMVGGYHAGYSLANRTLDVIFIWLGAASGPALVMALERGGRDALSQAAREQAGVMLLIGLPAAVGVALTAQPLAELMVGEALRDQAVQVTPWVAAAALMGGFTTYYLHQAFTLGRRTWRLMAAMAIPAALNLALNLVLVPRYGATGAAGATAISYTIGAAASFALGRAAQPLPVPLDTLIKAGAATALMAGAVVLLPSPGGLIELVLKAGVGAVVYGAAVWLLDAADARKHATAILRPLRARLA